MDKNPKKIAGIAGLAVMVILAIVLAIQMIPTIGEVRREMSLTPTPLPPVLMFHGTKDRTVNCTGSAVLYRRLKETGHDATFYLVKGADHGGPEFWTEHMLDIVDAFCRRCFGE